MGTVRLIAGESTAGRDFYRPWRGKCPGTLCRFAAVGTTTFAEDERGLSQPPRNERALPGTVRRAGRPRTAPGMTRATSSSPTARGLIRPLPGGPAGGFRGRPAARKAAAVPGTTPGVVHAAPKPPAQRTLWKGFPVDSRFPPPHRRPRPRRPLPRRAAPVEIRRGRVGRERTARRPPAARHRAGRLSPGRLPVPPRRRRQHRPRGDECHRPRPRPPALGGRGPPERPAAPRHAPRDAHDAGRPFHAEGGGGDVLPGDGLRRRRRRQVGRPRRARRPTATSTPPPPSAAGCAICTPPWPSGSGGTRCGPTRNSWGTSRASPAATCRAIAAGSVRVDGDTAVLTLKPVGSFPGNESAPAILKRVDGRWKLAMLASRHLDGLRAPGGGRGDRRQPAPRPAAQRPRPRGCAGRYKSINEVFGDEDHPGAQATGPRPPIAVPARTKRTTSSPPRRPPAPRRPTFRHARRDHP